MFFYTIKFRNAPIAHRTSLIKRVKELETCSSRKWTPKLPFVLVTFKAHSQNTEKPAMN